MFLDEKVLEVTESKVLTAKGAEVALAGALFSPTADSIEMGIIAHLKNKYDILSNRFGYSPEEREILDTLSYVESDAEFSKGSDPIIGRTLGFIYEKPNLTRAFSHSKEIEEMLKSFKKDSPEYYLSLIRIKEQYRDLGIGSAVLKYSEYKFAKELYRINKKVGFIDGSFSPFDETKTLETEEFYRKNGFEIYDKELFKPIITEQVLDETAHIFER